MRCIYKITNKVNGNFYIGLTNNFERRKQEHLTPKNVKNKTTALARAFRKHGISNFTFEVLLCCDNGQDLHLEEKRFIKELSPSYNMNEGGKGNGGRCLSDDLKSRLSAKSKEIWAAKTIEEKSKIIANLTGPKTTHVVSEETRKKISLINKGRKQTNEANEKRRQKAKINQIGNSNGNKPVIALQNGKIIKEYISAKVAADEIKIHPSNITKSIKGVQKSAGGFNWQFKNKNNEQS